MIEIKHMIFWMPLGAMILSGCRPIQSSMPCPMTPPEETIGWDLQKVDEAFRSACEMGATTLIIVTDGKVVRSMGDVNVPYHVHSVRKALLSALVGQRQRIVILPKTNSVIVTQAEPTVDSSNSHKNHRAIDSLLYGGLAGYLLQQNKLKNPISR